jgi:hypothetical protein
MRMHFRTALRHRSLTGRLFGGAMTLVVLMGVGLVPLCSPLSLGAMRCCQQASSPMTPTASQPPCCAINGSVAGNDAVAFSRAVTSERTLEMARVAAPFTFAPVPNPLVAADLAWQVFRPVERPLYIRNSVFLI